MKALKDTLDDDKDGYYYSDIINKNKDNDASKYLTFDGKLTSDFMIELRDFKEEELEKLESEIVNVR
jgi:hypothetical protein